jgi:ATP-binding cassette subfamily F protein 3
MAQSRDDLPLYETPLSLVRDAADLDETGARTFLHRFLFSGGHALARVGELSYGERVKLKLALLVVAGANLLLLDEPLNHLDIPSREQFQSALLSFDGTVLAATHDRAFIRAVATSIWMLRPGPGGSTLRSFASLDEVHHVQEVPRTEGLGPG